MEFEQIVKRLEWLDDEHRKDKAALSALEERIAALDTSINVLSKQIKEVNKKVSEIGPVSGRIDQFEEIVSKQREEMNNALDDLEKNMAQRMERFLQRRAGDAEVRLERYLEILLYLCASEFSDLSQPAAP